MVTVGLYIYINDEAKRVELFDDEKISVNSSIQNISDISKVYTDFSQSFTVPATNNNNKIFSHWYESSIDNGYDARYRKKAYIELDTIPFRSGNIQLEKASLKNGKPENYTITFFGALVSLKDIFSEKKLFDLDFSAYNFEYTGFNVVSRVKGTVSNDVKFPLISSNRVWQETGTTDNITTSGGAILTNELFPALRLNKVFDTIESFYGITFEGDFLTDARFTNAFLYLKNAETFIAKSTPTKITFTTSSGFPLANRWFLSSTLTYVQPVTFNNTSATLTITATDLNIDYSILVYKNGSLISTLPVPNKAVSVNVFNVINFTSNSPSNVGSYEFYLQSEDIMNYATSLNVSVVSFGSATASNPSKTTTGIVNVSNYMPDIKVQDFFSGVLKMFNLTCYSETENVYQIRQLEEWYNSGNITDITKHIISDNLDIDRIETFNKINFSYQKSESLMNVAYKSNNGVEYGDLLAEIDSDGGEYKVELPFENMLFNKFTGQNLQVGYALKQDLKNYQPKPIILYDYGTLQTCNFYLKYDTINTNITTYNAFGQDTLISGVNYSLNFDANVSSLLLTPINNSLYRVYYENYISNIFNSKQRKYNLKGLLPISILTSIKLNDRLVIRDKRYIINTMKVDLTTGEVDFELINDFRTL